MQKCRSNFFWFVCYRIYGNTKWSNRIECSIQGENGCRIIKIPSHIVWNTVVSWLTRSVILMQIGSTNYPNMQSSSQYAEPSLHIFSMLDNNIFPLKFRRHCNANKLRKWAKVDNNYWFRLKREKCITMPIGLLYNALLLWKIGSIVSCYIGKSPWRNKDQQAGIKQYKLNNIK